MSEHQSESDTEKKPAQKGHVHGPGCNHHHGDHPEHNAIMPFVRETKKIGRNDPCSCGSGKKAKKCCGVA